MFVNRCLPYKYKRALFDIGGPGRGGLGLKLVFFRKNNLLLDLHRKKTVADLGRTFVLSPCLRMFY